MDGPTTPGQKLKQLGALLQRHSAALLYVWQVILPRILLDRRRPVIFSRYTGMGDIICTIPATLELRKRHVGAAFIYNCHPDFAPVPRLAGAANQVTTLESIGLVGRWYRCLLEGFYHFAHGDDTPGQVAQDTMVAEFCRQFELPITDEHPDLPVTAAALERTNSLLVQKGLDPTALVLIHPGPSWKVKEWPRDRWVQLVAELRAAGHTNIAQLGVARYVAFQQVAIDPIPGAVSLVDALTVEECIAVISLAKLFIGIDSGLLHIAASTRTPAMGLFGSTAPEFFYPLHFRKRFIVTDVDCAGCQHRLPRLHWITGCPFDIRCMDSLDVDRVLQACIARMTDSTTR